jgi:RNA polymerase sigma-70 factor (ECF subfamily)
LEPTEAEVEAPDEDVRLMLAFSDGDTCAFDALFARWAPRLVRYLERMLRNRSSAAELTQETFLRVHRARDRYRADAHFSTWLYRIATNLALNELRRPRERDPHTSIDTEAGPELLSDAPGGRRCRACSPRGKLRPRGAGRASPKAAGRTPALHRGGCSYAEIAEALAVTEKAVKALVHRARTGLATRLAQPKEAT